MDKMQTLHSFWSGFGLKAYDENTVPDGAVLPYLTYSAASANFDEPVMVSSSLWYRSMSWLDISQKADEINDAIGVGGVTIPFDGGMLWIKRGTPFAQRMSDEDDTIRRIYLNVEAEFEAST